MMNRVKARNIIGGEELILGQGRRQDLKRTSLSSTVTGVRVWVIRIGYASNALSYDLIL